jgi:hypothetical protein
MCIKHRDVIFLLDFCPPARQGDIPFSHLQRRALTEKGPRNRRRCARVFLQAVCIIVRQSSAIRARFRRQVALVTSGLMADLEHECRCARKWDVCRQETHIIVERLGRVEWVRWVCWERSR